MTSPSVDRLYAANSSMAVKVPCRVATTAAITRSGEQTIDGVAVVTGDRVLVKDQASGVENGIYIADTSSWQRAPDFDGARDVCQGTLVKVNDGALGMGFWYVSTTGTITPGTTSIAFGKSSSDLADVSVFMQGVLADENAEEVLTSLGVTAFMQGVLADEDALDVLTSLGVTAFMQALLAESTALDARVALGAKYLQLEDYGGGTGIADNSAALAAAVADMAARGTYTIKLNAGTYNFTSKPSDFSVPVLFVGEGMSLSRLAKNYSEAGGNDVGFLTWSGSGTNGAGLLHCMVLAQTGTTGGTMVKFYTGSSDVAGYHRMGHVVVTHTGTGTYYRCLLVDGQLNTTSGSQGLRDFQSDHCFLFKEAGSTESARFKNATNLNVHSLWANGNVVVTGGGSATSNTTNARIDLICLAQLFVSETKYLHATGTVDTLNFSTGTEQCQYNGVIQTLVGGFADTGTSNYINTLKPWISYTPTVTAGSGTFTTVSATGRYIREGRIVHFQIEVTITTNGTAATSVIATLPVSSANVTGSGRTVAGREVISTGNMLQGFIGVNSPSVTIRSYDNTYPGADGRTLHVNGSYEVA